jgi:hypothetical protein
MDRFLDFTAAILIHGQLRDLGWDARATSLHVASNQVNTFEKT